MSLGVVAKGFSLRRRLLGFVLASILFATTVLGVTALMCVISGLFAVNKLLRADPAELF